jgi:ABC-2 type transport system permease protein
MSSNAADLAAPVPALSARAGILGTLVTLARRELWEHRGLWMAPAVTAGLLVLCAFSVFRGEMNLAFEQVNPSWLDGQQKAAALAWGYMGISALLYLVMAFVLSFYLLDCLYAERKDRSILFWKSLPVSDGLTVTAKFLVAAVVVPLAVYLLVMVSGILITAIYDARVALGHAPTLLVWDPLAWLKIQAVLLLSLIFAVLWYAPLAACLMLVSAWARRSPFVWATVPPVLAPLLERIAFGTHYLWSFIAWRMNGVFWLLGMHQMQTLEARGHHSHMPMAVMPDFGAAFTSPDLWLGVAAAAALLYAATRIRRYRDDT